MAVRDSLGNNQLAFVVKSDAYGHGIEKVSTFVEEENLADYLAVTSLAEGNLLRESGIELPILMLTPPIEDQIETLISLNIEVTIDNLSLAKKANEIARKEGEILTVQILVDTGMGRFGVLPDQVVEFFSELQSLENLQVEGVYTHCSVADSEEDDDRKYTEGQIKTFRECLGDLDAKGLLPPKRHIANSATFESFQDQALAPPLNMARLGCLIYGCHEGNPAWGEKVTPVMKFQTRIVEIRELPPGKYISYERTYKTTRDTKIGVLPVGYCDGLDRRLSNKAEFKIDGKKVPVIGKICSNHAMVDLTGLENAKAGDEVTIFGKDPTIKDFAELIGSTLLEIWYSSSKNISRVYDYGD